MSGRIYAIDFTATSMAIRAGTEFDPVPINHKRFTAASEAELAALDPNLLLRAGNYVMGTNAEVFPEGGAGILWDAFGKLPDGTTEFGKVEEGAPAPVPSKAKKNSGRKELQSSTSDGKSSSPGDDAGKETTMKPNKTATKKAAKKKAAAPKAKKAGNGARGEKTLAVKAMLLRKSGCTRKDILEKTGWPSVSVQAMAKAAGLKLRKEKEPGKTTTYFGEEKAAK